MASSFNTSSPSRSRSTCTSTEPERWRPSKTSGPWPTCSAREKSDRSDFPAPRALSMALLNDPVDYQPDQDDWSPAAGMRRGVVHGAVAAAILAIVLVPLALWLPYVVLMWALRTPLAFGIAWLLLRVVNRAAGMVGPTCI